MNHWTILHLMPIALGLSACDAALSRYDRVDVDAGVNQAEALADGDRATSGESPTDTAAGSSSSGAGSTTTTESSAGNDGAANGGSASATTGGSGTISADGAASTTGDSAPPTAPSALKTAATSATGPDTRFGNGSSVVFAWSAAADAGVGLRDYTLIWFDGSTCSSGSPHTVAGLSATTYTLGGLSNGSTRAFMVRAYDLSGNYTDSACSGSFTIDQNPPPPLIAFSGTSGDNAPTTHTVGTNSISINFPIDRSDLHHVDIRRVAGTGAPADCTAGTVVKTFAIGQFNNGTFVDDTGAAQKSFSYRACVVDQAGNITSPDVASGADPAHLVANLVSKAHIMFTTSKTFLGDLTDAGGAVFTSQTGAARGDLRCKEAAAAASLNQVKIEPHWRAVLSDTTTDVIAHAPATGSVLRSDYDSMFPVAANVPSKLWTGLLDYGPNLNENGATLTTTSWTGSFDDGTRLPQTCDNWSSSNPTDDGAYGDANGAWDATWLTRNISNCDQARHLYCISEGP